MKNISEKPLITYLRCKTSLKSAISGFLSDESGEAGMTYILVLVIGVILAAFVFIPGLRTLGTSIMTSVTDYWTSMKLKLFPTV